MEKYSVLGLCIVPRYARANTASLELNGSPYCPPSHAVIHMSFVEGWPRGLNCAKRVYLGLSKNGLIEGCPNLRGGMQFHCRNIEGHI